MDNTFNVSNTSKDILSSPSVKIPGFDSVGNNRSTMPLSQTTPDIPYDKSYFETNPNQFVTPDNISAIHKGLTDKQTFLNLAPAVINQTVVGEIVGGTLESLGSVLDPITFLKRVMGDTDAFKRNMMEEFGNSIRNWARDSTPIYMTEHAVKDFAPDDLSWWANMTPSVASTISMMIPAAGEAALARLATKGIRALGAIADVGKGAEVLKNVEGINSAWKAVGMVDAETAALGKTTPLAWSTDILLPAIASRNMDSTREATGRYQQLTDQYKELFKGDPDAEAKAKKIAGDAVHYGYLSSHANIIFDIAEWTVLDKLMKPIEKGLEDKLASAIYKEGSLATKYSETTAKSILGYQSIKDRLFKLHAPDMIKVGLAEGFDETSMDYFMDEGTRNAEINNKLQKDDNTNMAQRFVLHHLVAKNWESFVGGAVGGILMGGLGSIKGAIQDKYFNGDQKTMINNMADSFISRSKDNEETIQQITEALSKNDHVTAVHLRNKLITNVLTKSAANGTLNMDIEMYKNLAKLTPEQRQALEFDKSTDGNVSFDFGSLSKDLDRYADIYKQETAKIRTGKESDRYLGFLIAEKKVNSLMLQDVIDKYSKEHKDFDATSLDTDTESSLNDLHPEAITYYNKLVELSKNKSSNDAKTNALNQASEVTAFLNENLKEFNQGFEKELLEETNENKQAILKHNIAKNNAIISMNDSKIQNYKDTVEKINTLNNKNDSEFEDFKKTLTNFGVYKDKVDNLHTVNTSSKAALSKGQSFIETLKATKEVIKADIENSQTKEHYAKFHKEFEDYNSAENGKFISHFKNELSKVNDEESINKLVSDLKTKNTMDSDVLSELINLANTKKKTIKSSKEKATVIENSPIHTEEQNVEPNKVTEQSSLKDKIDELNRQRRAEHKTIKPVGKESKNILRKLANKATEALVDGKFTYHEYTNNEGIDRTLAKYTDTIEQAKSQIDSKYDKAINDLKTSASESELKDYNTSVTGTSDSAKSSTFAPTSIKTSPNTVLTNANGEVFGVGNTVHINTEGVSTNVNPFEVYSLNESDNTAKLIVGQSKYTKNGKEFTRNKYVTISIESLSHDYKTLDSTENPVNSNFESNLLDAIFAHSNSISINKATHVYTYNHKGQEHTNTTSGSKIMQTKYSNTTSSESNATKFGLVIDKLVRHYFSNNIKENTYYGLNKKDFAGITEYLSKIKNYLDANGFKIITLSDAISEDGIKLFDAETGLGCELDMLLINERNEVFIWDTKTNKEVKTSDGTKNTLFDNKNGYNSFHTYVGQLNVYAALFKKLFNVEVAGLGVLPISINYKESKTTVDANDSSKHAVELTSVKPMEISSFDIDTAILQNRDLSNPNSVGQDVGYDGKVIHFRINPEVLNEPSTVGNKTIAEAMKIVNKSTTEIIEENTTHSDIVDHYRTLLDAIEPLTHDNKNIGLKQMYDFLVSHFTLSDNNGSLQLSASPIGLVIRNMLPGGSYGQYIIENVYNESEAELNSLLKDKMINGFTAYSYLKATVYMLDNIMEEANSLMSIESQMTNNVNVLNITPELVTAQSIYAINLLNTLKSHKFEDIEDYFSSYRYKIEFLNSLFSLKKAITLDSNMNMSIPDIFKLIKQSYVNANENFDIEEVLPILSDIPNILEYMKKDLRFKMKTLASKEIENRKALNNSEGISYDYKSNTLMGKDENHETKSIEWTDEDSQLLHNRYKTIHDNINTIGSEKYQKEDVIRGIVENYDALNTVSNNDLFVELNPNLKESTSTEFDKSLAQDNIYDIINNLSVGNEIKLELQDNGDIHIIHTKENGNPVIIGIMPNNETTIKGFKVVDDNNEYVGFGSIMAKNAVMNLLFGEETDKSENKAAVINYLAEMHKHRLTANANNRDSKTTKNSANIYGDLLRGIQKNNSTTTIEGKIQQIIDLFLSTNDKSVTNNIKYNDDVINNLLDVLFYGARLDFMDNYVPTISDISARIKYFDIISNNNNQKYKTIKASFKNSTTHIGTIDGISKPSVLIQKEGKAKQNLLHSIVPTQLFNGAPEQINILNKRKNGISDVRTGRNLSNLTSETNGKIDNLNGKSDGFYVLLKSTDGKLTPFPLKANTLEDSYKHHSDGNDYSEQAIEHVSNTIMNILYANATTKGKYLVGDRLEDLGENLLYTDESDIKLKVNTINSNIQSIMNDSKLRNLIVVDGDKKNGTYYPYFHAFVCKSELGDSITTVVKYTTFDGGATQYHRIEIDKGIARKWTINSKEYDKSKDNNFSNDIDALNKINPRMPSKALNLRDSDIDTRLKSWFTESKDNTPINKLLRQTQYNDYGQIYFGTNKSTVNSIESFTDPVTNKTYSSATQHALETNSLYNNIDFVGTKDNLGNVTPYSNMDLYGVAGTRFQVGVDSVTRIKKGDINNPTDSIKILSKNSGVAFNEVFDAIDFINSHLSSMYNDTSTHKGETILPEDSKIAGVSYSKNNDGSITFNHTYTDRIMQGLYGTDTINNPIVALLHEHIHKAIISVVEHSDLSYGQKLDLSKHNNDTIEQFIKDFQKDFENTIYIEGNKSKVNETKANELVKALGLKDISEVRNIVESFIHYVNKDIKDSNSVMGKFKEFDNNRYGDGVSQELYTYMTNPYIMKVLSIIKPSSFIYERKSNPNFIDKLVNMLVNLYNKVVSTFSNKDGYSEIEQSNYMKSAKDMLGDLYQGFANKDLSVINNKTEQTKTSDTVIEDNEEDIPTTDDMENDDEHYVSLLHSSNNNSIFENNSIKGLESTFKDDSNLKIC